MRTIRLALAALAVLLVVATAGLLWFVTRQQEPDAAYRPRIPSPTWTSERPIVLVDNGHWNVHSAERGYGPFTRLLTADGYTVVSGPATAQALSGVRVLVVANALGFRGVVRQLASIAGLSIDALAADAFAADETAAIERWVHGGGSLLLVADHAPAGRAAASLAARFGVTMRDGFVVDAAQSEEGAPAMLVFSRENGLLGSHPIVDGTAIESRINRIVTFTGQALDGGRATPLLVLSPAAMELPRRGAPEAERLSVAGLSQAVALEHGRGRVVVAGEAAFLTSQLFGERRLGLQWPGTDNERFARNVMAWLAGG
ncbi:MAG: hypothetical protein AB1635_21185 [Acidobacteriota bacterium]